MQEHKEILYFLSSSVNMARYKEHKHSHVHVCHSTYEKIYMKKDDGC